MDSPQTDERSLHTQRVLPFDAAAIYGAFADGATLASWWGPAGFSNAFEVFEFREGGAWVFDMIGPDGQRYANRSVFQRLVAGECVVIRHDCAPWFTLTVALTPAPQGTRLDWTQTFDDPKFMQAMRGVLVPANEQNLDRLTAALHG
ncbi:MAG: SRPBCC domain-containing protein [Hydrogenophaga sp.]|uniref:SRPBCC domain-containing protein n=1 Tax=Hydrogenophaga sp. TaxID=1904254 RepID=UPI001D8A6ADA|nr:SRPBCC domain-containing protein [Hydrogenophaga sp.]MBX3611832.1 SRPBCC domain-containing protein [Hydrogenophaga sp.]